jgi:hypothetical protein
MIILFVLPYLCRKARKEDVIKHSMYAFAQIIKKTGSSKNGNHWHYEFLYKGKVTENYQSTDVNYEVKVGDFFCSQFFL